MSWLAITWFIFELMGVGTALDLRKPQVFKNVSLKTMIDKTFTFRRIFKKKLHHIFVKVEAGAVPFYRFQLPLSRNFAAFGSSFRFRFHHIYATKYFKFFTE